MKINLTSDEGRAISRRLGKWSVVGIPHKGWACEGVEDLGEPLETCEMCEQAQVRYVHVMTHPDFGFPPGGDPLRCGCVCAGHMEGDLSAARGRERDAKSRAIRRENFVTSTRWRSTASGNARLKYKGCYAVIVRKITPRGVGFRSVVYTQGALDWRSSKLARTERLAKLKAFDAIDDAAGWFGGGEAG